MSTPATGSAAGADAIVIPKPKARERTVPVASASGGAAATSSSGIPRRRHTAAQELAAVIATSDDAAVSKLCAASLGYFVDPFLPYFTSAPQRRPPLINRGYYARAAAIQHILREFLCLPPQSMAATHQPTAGAAAGAAASVRRQIVSLGAGADTTYFRLKAAGEQPVRYVEVDFADAMQRKAKIIAKHKRLSELANAKSTEAVATASGSGDSSAPAPAAAASAAPAATDSNSSNSSSSSSNSSSSSSSITRYADLTLIGADLRDMAALRAQFAAAGVDMSIPTLVLSECVLVYMSATDSAPVIEWAASSFSAGSVFVSYEQILPHDAFGRTMLSNLEERGCPLRGLERYPDIDAHRQRYTEAGYRADAASGMTGGYGGWDMRSIYDSYLDRADVARIERLELFDELEEWHLIQQHYHISIAWKAPTQSREAKAWESIAFVGRQPKPLPAIKRAAVVPRNATTAAASTDSTHAHAQGHTAPLRPAAPLKVAASKASPQQQSPRSLGSVAASGSGSAAAPSSPRRADPTVHHHYNPIEIEPVSLGAAHAGLSS